MIILGFKADFLSSNNYTSVNGENSGVGVDGVVFIFLAVCLVTGFVVTFTLVPRLLGFFKLLSGEKSMRKRVFAVC